MLKEITARIRCSNCGLRKRQAYREWCIECLSSPTNIGKKADTGRYKRPVALVPSEQPEVGKSLQPCVYCALERMTRLRDDENRACCSWCQNR